MSCDNEAMARWLVGAEVGIPPEMLQYLQERYRQQREEGDWPAGALHDRLLAYREAVRHGVYDEGES
jgi:hypothetical protein